MRRIFCWIPARSARMTALERLWFHVGSQERYATATAGYGAGAPWGRPVTWGRIDHCHRGVCDARGAGSPCWPGSKVVATHHFGACPRGGGAVNKK